MKRKGIINTVFTVIGLASVVLTGCVDQTGTKAGNAEGSDFKVVATSPAVTDIMARLDMDLVGVPESSLSQIPPAMTTLQKLA